jgi:Na+-transporting NADH:ubiquinone oxidoreductase subunit C
MNNESPAKTFLVVLLVAVVCSALVSTVVVVLRPIQLNNQLLERSRNIMQLTGLLKEGAEPDDEEMLTLFKSLDTRLLNIDDGSFDNEINIDTFDQRRAANNAELSVVIPSEYDQASLGQRSRYAIVYLVWKEGNLERIILPIHGEAMWSTLYGYMALEADFNTIAAATFYEHAETPGLGDQITRPDWLAQWQGRQIYDSQGERRFAVSTGQVQPGSQAAQFEVDALTGATVTTDAVTELVHYWMGPHGYQPFLNQLREQAPVQNNSAQGEDF